MAVTPTGNIRRSWEIVDVSEYAPHLIGPCVKLAMANGLDGRSERYVCALQESGELTVACIAAAVIVLAMRPGQWGAMAMAGWTSVLLGSGLRHRFRTRKAMA
ncbi:MAG: hypothetical protein JKP95_00445 [Oceanicaulis sp.]|nr:hypothetical protein [Oceanicaulis sp.]